MSDNYFDTGFRFEQYINERLLEISDEGERRALKDVMREMMIPFYRNTEKAYEELQQKCQATIHGNLGRYEMITGLMEKDKIDTTEEAMVVMNQQDLGEQTVDVDEMLDALGQREPFPVMKVYLNTSYKEIRRILIKRPDFNGKILTDAGEYRATFRLRQDHSYLKQVTDLYVHFAKNNIPWSTVCAPYLAKFFYVDLIKTDCPEVEEIRQVIVDFEEYQDIVFYDMVPVWNVRILEERTSAYPSFAMDQIHYDHCIFKERLQKNRDYLVSCDETRLWNVYRENDDLHIICDSNSPVRFQLYEFLYDAYDTQYSHPVFHNHCEEPQVTHCVHTKAQVKHFVRSLGYEDWISLVDMVQTDSYEGSRHETYAVDAFLEDEIRTCDSRKILIFQFAEKKPGHVLNQDIMSYLVGRIQWLLPEFECIGAIVAV